VIVSARALFGTQSISTRPARRDSSRLSVTASGRSPATRAASDRANALAAPKE
jgi:hypothetical protein